MYRSVIGWISVLVMVIIFPRISGQFSLGIQLHFQFSSDALKLGVYGLRKKGRDEWCLCVNYREVFMIMYTKFDTYMKQRIC